MDLPTVHVYNTGIVATLYFCEIRMHVHFSWCVLFQVKVTRRETPDGPEITIRELNKGDFFGEKALQGCAPLVGLGEGWACKALLINFVL